VRNIKIKIYTSFFFLGILYSSCSYFSQEEHKVPIAKIQQKKLYTEDINPILFKGLNKQDSILQMKHLIENWAFTQLMIDKAKKNIDTSYINKLVEDYKNDLMIETYQNLLAEKFLDTMISQMEYQKIYHKFGNIYWAKEALIKYNLLIINKKNKKTSIYKKWFFSDKNEEKDSLFNHMGEFKKLDFKQEWYYLSDVKKQIPVLKGISEKNIIKKSKKFVLSDSLDLYLIFIKNFIKKGQKLPLDYVKPELKQIILTNRKEKWLEKLKNQIIEEAIEKKKLKIYQQKNEDKNDKNES